ncbi:MAG: hypothetical protein HYR66_06125 [Sphingobacteriales bacterium]|nr:hypothetical protein [Sphingobacteriales bacterium]MBI3717232.1 hypothetical protein [Sphingobacteriales bacterium]
MSASGQSKNSNSILIRHDTTSLKASECEWLIKSLPKNKPALTIHIGTNIPDLILHLIEKGEIIATDIATEKPIPGKEIYTWNKPVDTVAVYDINGNIKDSLIKQERLTQYMPEIKIYQDWFLDMDTGKFYSEVKWIELMEGIYTSNGFLIGYAPAFRIYY